MTYHLITPPPELWQQWYNNSPEDDELGLAKHIATQAARWGADQQLTKDANWLDHNALNETHLQIIPMGESLKKAMRFRRLSLKENALKALDDIAIASFEQDAADIIRHALEQLNDIPQ